MRRTQMIWKRYLTLVAILFFANSAAADGKFFQRLEVADEPGIRAQRAVVAFRDGIETLIVQSDVFGQGEGFAWVLPLPAEPIAIEACPSNTLTAMNAILQPHVEGFPRAFLIGSVAGLLIAAVFCFDHLYCLHRPRKRYMAVEFLAVFVFLLLVAYLMLPSLGRAAEVSGAIDVLQTTRAGIYDITVVKSERGEVVENWLTTNGFACPPAAGGVIRDYAADGWCFLTARISPDEKGQVTHHPLKVTFPVTAPVYPTRLTGVDGKPVLMDVYVISDQQADAKALRTWMSDSFFPARTNRKFGNFAADTSLVYEADGSRRRIGIPVVAAAMWPQCVVTRLHGRMTASDMRNDLTFGWKRLVPHQATVYSRSSALGWGGGYAAITVAICLIGFTIAATRKNWSGLEMLKRRGPVLVVVAGAVMFLPWMSWEVVPSKAGSRGFAAARVHHMVLKDFAREIPSLPFPDAYRQALVQLRHGKAADAAKVLETPGDYTIDATSNGWRLTLLDEHYTPIAIDISSNGTPQPAVKR